MPFFAIVDMREARHADAPPMRADVDAADMPIIFCFIDDFSRTSFLPGYAIYELFHHAVITFTYRYRLIRVRIYEVIDFSSRQAFALPMPSSFSRQ